MNKWKQNNVTQINWMKQLFAKLNFLYVIVLRCFEIQQWHFLTKTLSEKNFSLNANFLVAKSEKKQFSHFKCGIFMVQNMFN